MQELHNNDERIEALETQNTIVLASTMEQKAEAANQRVVVEATQKMNHELMDKMKRLFHAEV